MGDPEKLPEDIEALHAALLATGAELASVRAQQSDDQALIAHLKLQIEKLNRDRYGPLKSYRYLVDPRQTLHAPVMRRTRGPAKL